MNINLTTEKKGRKRSFAKLGCRDARSVKVDNERVIEIRDSESC